MMVRTPIAFGAAALLTGGLFVGMNALITSNDVSVWTKAPIKLFDTRIPERPIAPPELKKPPVRPVTIEQPAVPDLPIAATGPGDYRPPVITAGPPAGPTTVGNGFGDRNTAQPMARFEPNFGNISKPETLIMMFDVSETGAVIKNSILVIESSNTRLNREAVRTIARWKYAPKVQDGKAVVQRGISVKFNIQPPE